MTAQIATLELSQALAIELHELFRALDLRVRTPELIRDKLTAASHRLDELLESEWSPIPAITESIEHVAELLWTYPPDDSLTVDDATWASLKAELREVYIRFASALRIEQVEVPALRPTNIRRSIFHVSAAAICLVLTVVVFTPSQLPWAAGTCAGVIWILEALRWLAPGTNVRMMAFFSALAHEQEHHQINSATWFGTAMVLLALTFSPLLCVIGVAVLGAADPLAGLVGRRFGRTRLLNNRSLEGTLTFVLTGTLAAAGAMLLVEPTLSAGVHWLTAAAAAVAGGLAELFSRRLDDNLSIPMAAAGAAWGVLTLLGVSAWG